MIKTIINKYKNFVVNLRIYSLNIAIAASLLLVVVFLGATSYLYMQAPSTIAYKQELAEYFRQENTKREWKRLHKYHGYPPVVIYEEGKAPYFYDKQGSKSAFIYPSKKAGLIIHQAEDSDYYAKLALNEKPMIK
ncbi:MAG: hypothetical protein A2031_09690 [Deltaproteobacteria bacterium RBG_19FT_COMBO_43_11]|nr:MAG: hypothetical protein A2W27_00225 [Deltaproteobacteria bacterium RBG_16_44_11]OGP88069.1 MAG: hypothetical protein A2031_09690 [Deltaproteobacteria bacterium RBG_19FT_COMBO_43_11]